MPRRDRYLEAYWIDPLFPELNSERKSDPKRKGSTAGQPEEAVFIVRDRIGFRYERTAGLTDFVSQREAAGLLRSAVMTVNRWVREGNLPSRTLNGVSVIKFADLVRFAEKKGLIDPNYVRTRVRAASMDEMQSDPGFSGFVSERGHENMYIRFFNSSKPARKPNRKRSGK